MDEGENRQVVIGVDTHKDLHVALPSGAPMRRRSYRRRSG
jgi:hypothetical protein